MRPGGPRAEDHGDFAIRKRLSEDGKQLGFRRADGIPVAMKTSFGVLGDLLGGFEVHFVDGVFVEFAVIRRVVAANLRAGVIDSASVVGLQVFARGMHEQVPNFVLDENGGAIVEEVPSHEVEVLMCGRFFDGECEVAAATRGAVIAKAFAGGDFFTLGDATVDGLCGRKYQFLKHRHGPAVSRKGSVEEIDGGPEPRGAREESFARRGEWCRTPRLRLPWAPPTE